jgi:alkanesulfonate monooxygenase SsuD/methylene tetrahydromethanopterin reductase-like flavin-dependent oxidoreductase (luciferase family)
MTAALRCGLFVMGTRGGGYGAMLEQACRAEELGFDSIVLAERHFRHADLLYPSPLEVGAAIAARTERIRIGCAGRILSLDHPIHVAEDAATLDVLSGGRLDFGATRASLDAEAHAAFDAPLEQSEGRFREALEVIGAAWTNDAFSYEGQHFRIPEVSVQPKPLQRPHPPIFLVAVSPSRLEFAAEMGLSVYIGAIRTAAELAETAHGFRAGLLAAGHDPDAPTLSVNRFVHVAESDEEAVARFERPFMELMRERAPDLRGALVAKYGSEAELTYARFLRDFAIVGGPGTVTAGLEETIEATGTSYLLLTVNFLTLDHELCLSSMELLAAEVLPALARNQVSGMRKTVA